MNYITTSMTYEQLGDVKLIEKALKALYAESWKQCEDEDTIRFTLKDKCKYGIYGLDYEIKMEVITIYGETVYTETGTVKLDSGHSLMLFEMDRPDMGDHMTAAVNTDNNYVYWF